MICAIAAENDLFDAEAYRALLAIELGENVDRWKTEMRFTGWQKVRAQLPLFLESAAASGIDRALVAIDNDGGSKRHLEHESNHEVGPQASDPDGCRFCALTSWIPESWRTEPRRACIVVPVQAIETWLLALRGDDFGGRPPESHYYRPHLKKRFFGPGVKGPETCRKMAVDLLAADASKTREVLRQRASYRLFVEQLETWRAAR